MKDGGEVALDWMDNSSLPTDVPVILILPGLTGK